jgi:hypothetical protein
MLTILSALLGFIGGLAPEVMKFFKEKEDKKHELAIMDKQIQATAALAGQKLEEINVQGDVAESVALYKSAETKLTGYKLADALIEGYNSGVRPTITYCFLIFYGSVKLGQSTVKWDEFDQNTFSLVLGYWFGQRSAAKLFGRK